MYWWNHAAELACAGKIQRFGFVTTNSLRQTFHRRVLEKHLAAKKPLSILFAIPDHPWVDSADGAAVRIAMTTAAPGSTPGILQRVIEEKGGDGDGYEIQLDSKTGCIQADLTVGANVAGAVVLVANEGLASEGVKPHGMGFVVTEEEAHQLGIGKNPLIGEIIKPYLNGRDLAATCRNVRIIDLFGMQQDEVRAQFPVIYQWILERVKPDRDAKVGRSKDADQYAKQWWLFGKTRGSMRKAIAELPRYVATVKTAKHRFFTFLDGNVIPDSKLITIASDDAFCLGVLSSKFHCLWSLAAGSHLGVGNDPTYVIGASFSKFPFPEASEISKNRIRFLGEQLDAHRKARQAQHPELTMTGMYNVLEKLRSGAELTAKEKTIHEQGLVSVLKQLHDELDAAVAESYGWPSNLSDEEILERLVALNVARAAEEAQGKIRWLRPSFQCPEGTTATQAELDVAVGGQKTKVKGPTAARKSAWPKALPEQVRLLRAALAAKPAPVTAEELARSFTRARTNRIADLLETLTDLGQARKLGDDRYFMG
jgi:hypothetical protein